MRTQNTKLNFTLVIAGTLLFLASSAIGQQTPAQRYQPVRQSESQPSPPSVHIPVDPAQNLAFQVKQRPAEASSNFKFTDSRGPAIGSPSMPTNPTLQNPAPVRRASFQDPGKTATPVPAILSGRSGLNQQNPANKQFRPGTPSNTPLQLASPKQLLNPPANSPSGQNLTRKSPSEFASRMKNVRNESATKTPFDIANDPAIALEMAKLTAAAKSKTRTTSPQASLPPLAPSSLSKATPGMAQSHLKKDSPAHNRVFPASTDAPKLVANPAGNVATKMQLTRAPHSAPSMISPLKDSNVRPVSSLNDDSIASIRLAAPAIQVESFGPPTIGINKPATFKVVVSNNSSFPAQRILVGVNIPQWVDVENVNLTTGGKEISSGKGQARLVWNIDQIAANSSQTMTLTAVPRKPEMFDLGIEWTLVPRVGKSAIRVTQPRLEINISGPRDVLFGEKAVYHVTVRNPGTGTAENVVVMLPEALGGARASFGNIQAGKEQNCQVELLARTAGDLSLDVTATAEGDLTTSAEKSLTVRRAKLDIALTGPRLKYAGTIAQYQVTITNTGDATATELNSGIALPPGVKYLGGIESFNLVDGGIQWPVGSLAPGQSRSYKLNCQLDTSGELQLEVGARGKGDLAASSACLTKVETVADLVLSVSDPKGPLPTGKDVEFEIKISNRGTKSAQGVNLVMQFSEGVEPQSANGLEHRILPGQVLFSPITQIEPGQEISFKVSAHATTPGTHVFRAQLTCDDDADVHEMAEGTTRFYGDAIQPTTTTLPSTAKATDETNDFNGLK